MLKGIAASQGIAIAKVYKLEQPVLKIVQTSANPEDELKKLDSAFTKKIGLDANPFNDTTMIVGHTPTFRYGDEYRGKIAIGKNKQIYHIDCGCVFGKSLGCLRLDDLKEFYIPSLQPDRT